MVLTSLFALGQVAMSREPIRLERSHTLPTAMPPHPYGRDELDMRMVFGFARGRGRNETVETDDGHFLLRCKIYRRGLFMELQPHSRSSWPERLPEELSCAVGRYELVMKVQPIAALYHSSEEVQAGPERVAEVRRRSSRGGFSRVVFGLQAEGAWTAVTGRATFNGSEWEGVSCSVYDIVGGPVVAVEVKDAVADGTGACRLPTPAGGDLVIPIRLVTVDPAVPAPIVAAEHVAPDALPCPVTSLQRLIPAGNALPSCAEVDEAKCAAACDDGDSTYCLALAYELQHVEGRRAESNARFGRACDLGQRMGCTNYGAYLWSVDGPEDGLHCADKLFDAACEHGEDFACGMRGRRMFEQATEPSQYARTRAYMEDVCQRMGGFPCRVLGMQLETGRMGDYTPETISGLLEQACDGGDPDGCGKPATASETFH